MMRYTNKRSSGRRRGTRPVRRRVNAKAWLGSVASRANKLFSGRSGRRSVVGRVASGTRTSGPMTDTTFSKMVTRPSARGLSGLVPSELLTTPGYDVHPSTGMSRPKPKTVFRTMCSYLAGPAPVVSQPPPACHSSTWSSCLVACLSRPSVEGLVPRLSGTGTPVSQVSSSFTYRAIRR